MITYLFSGLCIMLFCLFSIKRMRPWLFFAFYHFFLGLEENEKQGQTTSHGYIVPANKTAGTVR